MSITDPIADYLTRLRNASRAKHIKVDIPASKLKQEITKILYEYKYIQNYIIRPPSRISVTLVEGVF